MKQTITAIALVLTLVFTATAWSQESPMERGKMGMGKMGMGESSQMKACMQMMGMMEMEEMETGEMEMGESPQMKGCMQMMGNMETTNAALDELVGRMQAAEGAEKVGAIEEVLTAMVAQRREMNKRMRSMPQMMCGGMMRMMMQ